MTSFDGNISVDGMIIKIENSSSIQLVRCLIIANALSVSLLSVFVESISVEYESEIIQVKMKKGNGKYAPAISFIADSALGHEVNVIFP